MSPPTRGRPRCAVAARDRHDPLYASAPPAHGFLLLEVPGAWPPDLLPASGLPPAVAAAVRDRAGAAGVRLLLIRRPGAHPERDGARRWGMAAVGGGVRWGEWRSPDDLLALDLAGEFGVAATGGPPDRPVALVCTQGRHDVCCAVEGRPVADVLGADPRLDAWECSHLGGDRFAANLLWLPAGRLFGGLTAATAGAVVNAALAGRVVLAHDRGRCGDRPAAQAAQWLLMRHLGEDHPGRVRVVMVAAVPGPGVPFSVFARHGVHGYRIRLVWDWSEPHPLTCRAVDDARVRVFRLADAAPGEL